ncbi:hypothetical protein WJX77_009665 [Trebouxia sp. C0004]
MGNTATHSHYAKQAKWSQRLNTKCHHNFSKRQAGFWTSDLQTHKPGWKSEYRKAYVYAWEPKSKTEHGQKPTFYIAGCLTLCDTLLCVKDADAECLSRKLLRLGFTSSVVPCFLEAHDGLLTTRRWQVPGCHTCPLIW